MTLQELHDWTGRILKDQSVRHVERFTVILSPLKFGDRYLNFDDLALRPPEKEKP